SLNFTGSARRAFERLALLDQLVVAAECEEADDREDRDCHENLEQREAERALWVHPRAAAMVKEGHARAHCSPPSSSGSGSGGEGTSSPSSRPPTSSSSSSSPGPSG